MTMIKSQLFTKAIEHVIPIGTPRRIITNRVKQWKLLEKVTSEGESLS